VDILTSPGCQLEESDLEMILEKERWVREFWMQGGDVHVTTPAGTDLRAKLVKTDKRSARVLGILQPNGERRGAGTWPFGECRVTPLEGSGEGTVVWDICGHAPPGRYAQPVVLTVKAGRVVNIEGGKEADGVRRYFEAHGDENSYAAPAEISVGLNHKAVIMGTVRNDKKALGTSHIAIGRSDIGGTIVSATHFDGLMAKPTITVNGKAFIKDGVLQRDL
jgi:leucyl aminopeptidase (aminopeptidase T)